MDIIKGVAKSMGLAYKFGTYKEANYMFDRSDKTELPAVCELTPLKGSFEIRYEAVKDSQEITLLFLDIDQKTVNSEKTAEIIDRMKSKALEFIKLLNETGRYEVIDETSLEYYTVVKQFDKSLSGLEITLKLTPVNATCL